MRPAAERAPVDWAQFQLNQDGVSITAEQYAEWGRQVNEGPPPDYRLNRPSRENAQSCRTFADRVQSILSSGQRLECRWSNNHTLHAGFAPYDPGEPDIVIRDIRYLPHRCRITPESVGSNVMLQERIRIQETGEYPTLDSNRLCQTPVFWAWVPGYTGTEPVPYEGQHFRVPAPGTTMKL